MSLNEGRGIVSGPHRTWVDPFDGETHCNWTEAEHAARAAAPSVEPRSDPGDAPNPWEPVSPEPHPPLKCGPICCGYHVASPEPTPGLREALDFIVQERHGTALDYDAWEAIGKAVGIEPPYDRPLAIHAALAASPAPEPTGLDAVDEVIYSLAREALGSRDSYRTQGYVMQQLPYESIVRDRLAARLKEPTE